MTAVGVKKGVIMHRYRTVTKCELSQVSNEKADVVPLPPAAIELSPQFSRDGLQVHEVTEATAGALPVDRRQHGVFRRKMV